MIGLGLFVIGTIMSILAMYLAKADVNDKMRSFLGGDTTHTRKCERRGAADLEVSGSSVWCPHCGTSA